MGRSVRAVLGSLSVVAVCAAAPLAVADGCGLFVGGVNYTDRNGCVLLGEDAPRDFQNDTDSVVTIYADATCGGISTGVLSPHDNGTYTGKSMIVS
ncbi:hypothetical protein F3087_35610 [Nocardia colli]|uniref:Uncharacterized protein n=1 Tax=Nocardia colli TaxID=2545717 RepID=A0A5N0E6E9_9NOCA|nr:hypothetical protein [Nocardia colli]KAA8883999.1 hypothetical protein F3087_35610 [Nocardia colli]